MSRSEEIRPVALSFVELCLAQANSQLGSHVVEILLNKKLHGNLVEGFRINLNTFF